MRQFISCVTLLETEIRLALADAPFDVQLAHATGAEAQMRQIDPNAFANEQNYWPVYWKEDREWYSDWAEDLQERPAAGN